MMNNQALRSLTVFLLSIFVTPAITLGQGLGSAPLKLKYYELEKPTSVDLVEYEGIRVSTICKNKKKRCQAIEARTKKAMAKRELGEPPLTGNPAARHCLNIGGANRIGKDTSGNQYDLCLFSDGSLADSWSLYREQAKENKILSQDK